MQNKDEFEAIVIESIRDKKKCDFISWDTFYVNRWQLARFFKRAEPTLFITCNPTKLFNDSDFKIGFSIITEFTCRNVL